MKEKILNYQAKRIIDRYKTYSEYSVHATKKEKKVVLKSTVLKANKLQRKTAGI